MINPGQFVLELFLVVAALALSWSLGKTRHSRFVIGFAALAGAVNCVFYYVAVGPLYRARGFGDSVVVGSVAFETARWSVLALALSGVAVRVQDAGVARGFALLTKAPRLRHALIAGVVAGVFVTSAVYLLSFVELHAGSLKTLPWPIANGEPVDFRLAIGAGVRNLVGEEMFARLGAQSIAQFALRRLRGGAVLAVILSSLYFEVWHNPFEVPQLLNFSASCVLGWAYQKYGYECAAVGHCVGDWLMLGVLPPLLFG